MPTDPIDISLFSKQPVGLSQLPDDLLRECLFTFIRVTSSPIQAIVTLTTAGPLSGGSRHCVAGALASGDKNEAGAKAAELLEAVHRFTKMR